MANRDVARRNIVCVEVCMSSNKALLLFGLILTMGVGGPLNTPLTAQSEQQLYFSDDNSGD